MGAYTLSEMADELDAGGMFEYAERLREMDSARPEVVFGLPREEAEAMSEALSTGVRHGPLPPSLDDNGCPACRAHTKLRAALNPASETLT